MFGADRQRVWTSSTAKRYGWPARCTVKGLVVRREAEGDKALDEVSAKHVFRTRSVRKTPAAFADRMGGQMPALVKCFY